MGCCIVGCCIVRCCIVGCCIVGCCIVEIVTDECIPLVCSACDGTDCCFYVFVRASSETYSAHWVCLVVMMVLREENN